MIIKSGTNPQLQETTVNKTVTLQARVYNYSRRHHLNGVSDIKAYSSSPVGIPTVPGDLGSRRETPFSIDTAW